MSDSDTDGIEAERLLSFLERRERLEDEKKEVSDQIKELNAEVKSEGYDVKVFNTLIRLRKKSDVEREEEETVLEMYKRAVGLS